MSLCVCVFFLLEMACFIGYLTTAKLIHTLKNVERITSSVILGLQLMSLLT